MAHSTIKSNYHSLVERLNRFPQGAPESELLYAILKLLFNEREAGLVASLPIRPFTAAQAAKVWHMETSQARKELEALASHALLVDSPLPNGETFYTLPPPMAGFFEFSLMRASGDPQQKVLAELFYQYLNVEEDFVRSLFAATGTPLGRVFVQEAALPAAAIEILDYEKASQVVLEASHRAVGTCYCRHKMQHAGSACEADLDICLTFNGVAWSLIRSGHAREVGVSEGLDLLQKAYAQNLVQCGENVREQVAFICNCCGCCCEALGAARRFAFLTPVATTNFVPVLDLEKCSGCGKCVDACPVQAMSLVSARDPHHLRRRQANLDEDLCLGCGVCVRTCPSQGIALAPRQQRVITPLNSVHRVVLMAIERGSLQNLIFDNQALLSHRAMAAVFGAILRLPPAKQALASQQFRSHYLERLIRWGQAKLEQAN